MRKKYMSPKYIVWVEDMVIKVHIRMQSVPTTVQLCAQGILNKI